MAMSLQFRQNEGTEVLQLTLYTLDNKTPGYTAVHLLTLNHFSFSPDQKSSNTPMKEF